MGQLDDQGRQAHGGLTSVLILDPAHFQHGVQDHQLIRVAIYWVWSPKSSYQPGVPEEVWFEKLPNPFDFWRGMAPLSAATAAASTDYAGSLHMKGIMENNGESGPALRSDEQLDPEQREQILAALRDLSVVLERLIVLCSCGAARRW